jgi:hypothetical protein
MARAMLDRSVAMKDILFILVTAGFFGLAWSYARSFEKL